MHTPTDHFHFRDSQGSPQHKMFDILVNHIDFDKLQKIIIDRGLWEKDLLDFFASASMSTWQDTIDTASGQDASLAKYQVRKKIYEQLGEQHFHEIFHEYLHPQVLWDLIEYYYPNDPSMVQLKHYLHQQKEDEYELYDKRMNIYSQQIIQVLSSWDDNTELKIVIDAQLAALLSTLSEQAKTVNTNQLIIDILE